MQVSKTAVCSVLPLVELVLKPYRRLEKKGSEKSQLLFKKIRKRWP